MGYKTDIEKMRLYQQQRSLQKNIESEKLRIEKLEMCRRKLREYFTGLPQCNVYLFGSVITQNKFSAHSDIDIAVENYTASRLDLYSDLRELIQWPIDIVIMEKCHFSDLIKKQGIKIN